MKEDLQFIAAAGVILLAGIVIYTIIMFSDAQ